MFLFFLFISIYYTLIHLNFRAKSIVLGFYDNLSDFYNISANPTFPPIIFMIQQLKIQIVFLLIKTSKIPVQNQVIMKQRKNLLDLDFISVNLEFRKLFLDFIFTNSFSDFILIAKKALILEITRALSAKNRTFVALVSIVLNN